MQNCGCVEYNSIIFLIIIIKKGLAVQKLTNIISIFCIYEGRNLGFSYIEIWVVYVSYEE